MKGRPEPHKAQILVTMYTHRDLPTGHSCRSKLPYFVLVGVLLIDMDETQFGNGRTIRSVKAAINKYGGKFNQVTDTYAGKKTQKKASESKIKPSKGQLHIAKKRINQINEEREMAEKQKSRAELELRKAKKLVKDLNSQLEVSKAKANDEMKELGVLNKAKTVEVENHHCTEVARQVEDVKRELSNIRLDMVRLSEEKSRAEKEAEIAILKISCYMENIEQLRVEIEAAKEEEVLVELAQIEAYKELAAIEAQKKEESESFSSRIKETKRKINAMRVEIDELKDLEEKLAVSNSDVQVLQQLKLIKEMDASVGSSSTMKNSDSSSVTEDIEGAKKELESVKGGAFQLMTSMDGIRVELQRIQEEKDKLKKLEEKNVNIAKNLNSKVTKAKSKLRVAVSYEEKAKSTLSSLHLALETLEKEKEAAEKEKVDTIEETINITAEIEKTETGTDSIEEKLQEAIQELAEVKSGEAKSLKKLKGVIENAVRSRASGKQSTITISRFEYDYLTGCAVEAQAMADKKVAAAHAWAEALKASEREINMKVEAAERKIQELRVKEEKQMFSLEKSLKATQVVEGELQSKRQRNKNFQAKRSIGENAYQLTTVPQSKFRRSVGFPTTRRLTGSTSFAMKRRRKVMLKLAKYFVGNQTKDEKGIPLEKRMSE